MKFGSKSLLQEDGRRLIYQESEEKELFEEQIRSCNSHRMVDNSVNCWPLTRGSGL
jgi:hypothetical protein